MDATRVRFSKESELVRKVQSMAEAARRDVAGLEPRVVQALSTRVAIDKLRDVVGGLDTNARIAAERAVLGEESL